MNISAYQLYVLLKMKRKTKAAPSPKPSLTVLQTLALEIHSLAFFYIPKLPIQFNRDFTNLNISRSPLQWFFVAISFAHLLFQGILSGLLALYYGIFRRSEKDFGWERLVILALIFICFTGATLFGYSLLKVRASLISSFNELLKLKRALVLSGTLF